MFFSLENLQALDVSNFNTSNAIDMSSMFSGCKSLTSLDLKNFNTSNVTDMSYMFSECNNLSLLDISSFDTSRVTKMQYMFNHCYAMTTLNLGHFVTNNVENMSAMFCGDKNLTTLDISNFNTSKVTNMSSMFYDLEQITSLDLRHFNTSSVTNMNSMFSDMINLTSLDVSSFNTSNVTNMSNMFRSLKKLPSIDLITFKTSKVTDMSYMFLNDMLLTNLDLTSFDISNVTKMNSMFGSTGALNMILVRSQSDLDVFTSTFPEKNFSLGRITDLPVVKAKNANNNTILVTWELVPAAQNYIVYSSEDNKKWTTEATVADTSYTKKGLTYGKIYYFKVKAVGNQNSKTSEVVKGKTVPNKVENLVSGTIKTNSIKISWDKVGVTGYEVYTSTDNKKWTLLTTITKNTTLSYNNTGLKANKTYYYKVRAYKTVSGKKVYGSFSDVLKVKTAPEAPTFTIKANSYESLKLVITSVKGATKYLVYRSEEEKGTYTRVGETTTTSYIDHELVPKTTYYYKIKACNSANKCSGYSSIVSKKVTIATPKISLLGDKNTPVTIVVSNVADTEGYEVFRSLDNKTWTKIDTIANDTFRYEDYSAAYKKTYYYKVRTYVTINGKKGYSSFSTVESIKNLYND